MAGEPEVVWMPGGVRTEIQLDGEDTGGAFCLLLDEPPAGWSLPAHIHEDAAETIHVIEGEFEMTVDGETRHLGPGETLHIPAGVVHAGGTVGERPGRRLLVFSPAGMEEFFREEDAKPDAAGRVRSAAGGTKPGSLFAESLPIRRRCLVSVRLLPVSPQSRSFSSLRSPSRRRTSSARRR